MNEEKITELQAQDAETPVTVQVFDEDEQIHEEEYYASNLSRKRQFISQQAQKEPVIPTKTKKRTLFTAIGDFIYHHKVISVVLGIILVSVLVCGIIGLCQEPCDYNIGVYTAGESLTAAETENIEKLFRACGKDRDGDGEVTVKITEYHPVGRNELISFIHEQILRRDIYGDENHGERVNDIIITDETVRDMIYMYFGTLVFDEICEEGVWAETVRSELLGEDGKGESLGFMIFAYNYYDRDPQQAKTDHNDACEVFAAIVEKYPELFETPEAE